MVRVLLIATAVVLLSLGIRDVSGVLGADPMTLMRIVQGLCGKPGGQDQTFATQFYNCYNFIPPNEKCLFDKCQKEVFGNVLDSPEHIDASCKSPESLSVYQVCLNREFTACRKDIIKAVTTINICQGRLLGLE